MEPHCPHCYNGEVVEDNEMSGVFFCNICFRKVTIRKFKESICRT